MAMPSWETLQTVGVGIGAVLSGIWGGIKLKAHADKRAVPTYTGPPDEHPRKISRKEWHDILERVNKHGIRLAVHKRKLETLRADNDQQEEALTKLRNDHDAHVIAVSELSGTLGRVEERLGALQKSTDLANQNAADARREILARLDGASR